MGEPFDWERDYGPLYRACPSAFWLAPEPGERKRDVIDVCPKDTGLLSWTNPGNLNQLAMMQAQMSPYGGMGLMNATHRRYGSLGLGFLFG